jgi:hypothetical protein
VTTLDFLSPSRCQPGTTTSPIRRALDTVSDTDARNDAGLRLAGVRHRLHDLWLDGKVEIRGDLELVELLPGEELVRLTPRRAYLFTPDDPADVVARLREAGVLAYDATGALAGMAIEGEQLMRRLTDLDLDKLPTAGPLLSRVTAIVIRDGGERFRVYVPQELAHDVAMAVLDMARGLTPSVTDTDVEEEYP